MDEVQTGFGRTGANFAHQLYNIKPDIMGCGKAAGGGILPVSFVAGKKYEPFQIQTFKEKFE